MIYFHFVIVVLMIPERVLMALYPDIDNAATAS
jgi:hypothetical protein